MNRAECPREEDIVRALCDSHFDKTHNRFSSYVFVGPNTSVSRLLILPLNELFKIFHRDLDKPQKSKVIASGEINVGKLQDIGKNHNEPQAITVKIDPFPENKAHAIIPQKLSRSLAKKIIRELRFHASPQSA
ncbi:MAG: hypothetical protein Q6358_02740 [Candidatus Brocadiales bacterium]|nr:hypothetical protein [Candidatus Brocadiales bacterium]